MKKQYLYLKKQINTARDNKKKAEEKITTKYKRIDLSNKNASKLKSCINVYASVIVAGQIQYIPYTEWCDGMYDTHTVCDNKQCVHCSKQSEWVKACIKLDEIEAVLKKHRKEKILGLLK